MMRCLLCYQLLSGNDKDYHSKCIRSTFGLNDLPQISLDETDLKLYAQRMVSSNMAITGVQPKLSLWLEKSKTNLRFTVVDQKSDYIIKPQSTAFTALPENEDLCMHLAQEFGIKTAVHGLVRLQSGSLAYLTKRFDREGSKRISCEDLCQLTETLTEHKYRSSYEKTGKAIKKYSYISGMDLLRFFELVLFSYISGNADMHLKNFSMIENEDGGFSLSPAYDLVSTHLVIRNEGEQMSLTLNGKRNKLSVVDFVALGTSLGLSEKQIQNTLNRFSQKVEKAYWWIENSFLPEDHKLHLKELLAARLIFST